jgi:hypothetical protein
MVMNVTVMNVQQYNSQETVKVQTQTTTTTCLYKRTLTVTQSTITACLHSFYLGEHDRYILQIEITLLAGLCWNNKANLWCKVRINQWIQWLVCLCSPKEDLCEGIIVLLDLVQ